MIIQILDDDERANLELGPAGQPSIIVSEAGLYLSLIHI